MTNVDKIFEKSATKLDDAFLTEVSGGGVSEVHNISAAVAAGSLLSGLGCSVASCIYLSKANKARTAGNSGDYEKYIKKCQSCGISGVTLCGIGAGAFVVSDLSGRVETFDAHFTALYDGYKRGCFDGGKAVLDDLGSRLKRLGL